MFFQLFTIMKTLVELKHSMSCQGLTRMVLYAFDHVNCFNDVTNPFAFQVLHEISRRRRDQVCRTPKTLHRPLPSDLGHPFRQEVSVRKVQGSVGQIRLRRNRQEVHGGRQQVVVLQAKTLLEQM